MKIIVLTNGDVAYRRGWKTLIVNEDAKVDYDVFEAKAIFRQTIHYVISSNMFLNYVFFALIAVGITFSICVFMPEYVGLAVEIYLIIAFIFTGLLIYRFCIKRFCIKRCG